MGALGYDVRHAARALRKRPALSAVIVVTLALGIGANTAIFTIVDAVVLRPLPFRDPSRLVHIWENYPKRARYRWGSDVGYIIVRPGTYFDWKAQSRSFESMSAFAWRGVVLGSAPRAEVRQAHEVEDGFFDTLGVLPQLGRTLRSDDYAGGAARVAVISHALWTTLLGGDPHAVGRTVTLDEVPYTVVGVMPAGFFPTRWETPALWLPLVLDPERAQSRTAWELFTFARLRAGVSLEQAQEEMDVISDRLTAAYPGHYDNMGAVLTPVTGYLYSHYERLFALLLGAVGLVLVIGCANVASLLLARAAERAREVAVRSALGASRGRLVRQFLTESVLLSLAGAAAGVGLASIGIGPIAALLPASSRVPRIEDARLDGAVLLFTLGISVVSGLAFGIVPALRSSRADLGADLKEGGRASSAGPGARRLGDALVVAEVAISLVLLVAASLLFQSFRRLLEVDPGFRPDHVVAASISVPAHRYGAYRPGEANAARARLFDALEQRLREIPGAESAAVTGLLPLRHGPNPWSMHIEGRPAPPPSAEAYGGAAREKKTGLSHHGDVTIQRVTPGYFQTFGIPLRKGRYFDAHDTAASPMVAIINETNARRYFGTDDPIGRTIVIDMTSYFPRMRVVGVVADSRLNAVDKEAYPEVFWPMAQLPSAGGWAAVRVRGDASSSATALRQAIATVDRDVVITEATTMSQVREDSLWRPRLTAVLLGAFATLAAVMAAAGIYAIFSYRVSRRAREIGVRLALGAGRVEIVRLVLGAALSLAAMGIAAGAAATVLSGRFLASWVYGVSATDPGTIALVASGLAATAVLASAVPAWRATRVDPVVALRQE